MKSKNLFRFATSRRPALLSLLLLAIVVLALLAPLWRPHVSQSVPLSRVRSEGTIADRLQQYGVAARGRLKPDFKKANLPYPPSRLLFLGLKQEKRLELYGRDTGEEWRFVRQYPILGSSGKSGPKLKEGDLQVPEGIYSIESLNPNSDFHLSLRINYPNAFDKEQAKHDQRTGLGGDIMIHGNSVSVGCLAMGDQAAEDLFVLAADVGLKNIKVVLSPLDFRVETMPVNETARMPAWINEVYERLEQELKWLPRRN